jgi:hypothetical protein
MLSGAIAYQILKQEKPTTIFSARAVLKHHSWYESRWRSQLDKVPESENDELLLRLTTSRFGVIAPVKKQLFKFPIQQ